MVSGGSSVTFFSWGAMLPAVVELGGFDGVPGSAETRLFSTESDRNGSDSFRDPYPERLIPAGKPLLGVVEGSVLEIPAAVSLYGTTGFGPGYPRRAVKASAWIS